MSSQIHRPPNYMGYGGPQAQHQLPQQHSVPHQDIQFDEAAFERAFDEASAELDSIQLTESQAPTLTKSSTETAELLNPTIAVSEAQSLRQLQSVGLEQHEEIEMSHSDLVDAEASARSAQVDDDDDTATHPRSQTDPKLEQDEMSRTAAALLDSVADNTSDKFQQSNFLTLMRQFRDRAVKVEGKDIVPVDGENREPV